jgi:heme oxygenase
LDSLSSGVLTDVGYGLCIVTFAALFDTVIRAVETVPDARHIVSLADLRGQGEAARADAMALGHPLLEAPAWGFAPDLGFALGAIYALGGSRLGGVVIGSALRRAGRPIGAPGYRFFAMPSSTAAYEWRRLKTALDERLTDEGDLRRAGLGAGAVFDLTADLFGRVSDGSPHDR